MYTLGLSTMTETAAVLMEDGKVVAAAEEERFSRVKHDGGFPYQSIRFVLGTRGLTLGDVDCVAVYWDPYKLGYRARFMIELALRRPSTFIEKAKRAAEVWNGEHSSGNDSGWASMFFTKQRLEEHFGAAPRQVKFFDHHRCHMASCFYPSAFEEAAVLIMDGAGEAACTTWGHGQGTKIDVIDEHLLPHSLGHYYSAITGYLGFKMLDGEYKLMGLSPYGDRSGAKWIRSNFLRSAGEGRYHLETQNLDYHRALKGRFEGAFADHFGPPRERSETAEFNDRHRDIAASAQAAFEEAVIEMAEEVQRRTKARYLTIAGGCGLNCVANGKILKKGIFEQIYVPPVPHDAGGALGAAMQAYFERTGKRPEPIEHAQFGPSFDDGDVQKALAERPEVTAVRHDEDQLIEMAADVVASQDVISWVQGPMEYGPRALGNRSFVADPRNDSIRDVMNEKIKKRELFRPFAPSVKAEKASEYFEIDQPSPFMTIIVPVRPEARSKIPAVTHVDGTARPQTVERDVNPRYWKLIDAFERRTGVGAVLNTSYNIQEPIVCTPAEALATFVRSGVEAMALGDYWVTRK